MSDKSGMGYTLGVAAELSRMMDESNNRTAGTPAYQPGDRLRSSKDIIIEGLLDTGLKVVANALNIK